MAKEMFEKMITELDRVKGMLEIGTTTGKLPDIERDIMLSKLRIIYEFLLMYQPDVVDVKPPKKVEQTTKNGLAENAEPEKKNQKRK